MPRATSYSFPALVAASAVIYYFSNPDPGHYYDYTFRVAKNLLNGSIGFAQKPPVWLNEFVSFDGKWYSVFPLGSVLSMLPFALLASAGIIGNMPSAAIAAIVAGIAVHYLLRTAATYELGERRTVLMSLGILFGTWAWANITIGGAWQIALGFALVGQLGAIYYTAIDRRPLIAGAFFALAFGNRTEILPTAPIFMYLLYRRRYVSPAGENKERDAMLTDTVKPLARFCSIPFGLGIATLGYNYVRFGSIADFGYARIPGVLDEPWYSNGIFSPTYIPRQVWEMLFKPWEIRDAFPYLAPDAFSSSILIISPFLLFALRSGARDAVLKRCAWIAIAVITLVLWSHGNSGGWQFGYRYFIVCLPWLFLITLENSPHRISRLERAAYVWAFLANTYATWLFNWTNYMRP
ncbi:MAG: hypothetical protein AB7V18_06715 [Pyrinomonadaceae bacterium]